MAMDMAASIVKTMTAKKKAKSKSTKDKARNQSIQASLDISRPAVGGEGLYIKLTQHQKSISAHMRFISTALENGLHKTDLTTVVTKLLVQVDCAVTTSHQCFTREVFDRNDSLKPRLERSEHTMFQNVATLVRWADFTSKDQYIYPNQEEGNIVDCIRNFETALYEIVKLVSEIQRALSNSGPEAFQRVRRSSLDEGTIHSVTSPVDVPHPHLAALRGESKDRKTSWSPGMGPSSPSRSLGIASPFREKVMSLRPGMLRDSLLSTQSDHSSTSDEEKRRSGSAERYAAGQHSPEHSHDWESRLRSHTAPFEPYRGGPIPVSTPTIPATYDLARELPPLPGDNKQEPPPPPLPRKPTQFTRNSLAQPPIPARKGHTLPRASSTSISESPLLNGRWSPPDFPGTTEAKPPPIPVKQRKHQQPNRQVMNGHAPQLKARPDNYDTVPPPLPTKQRRSGAKTTSVTSPSHSPSHTPSHTPTHTPTHVPVRSTVSMDHGRPTALDQVTRIGVPPVPVRIESIPGLKNALETPPPKPPRTDRPVNVELPTPAPQTRQDEVASAINAVRKYNEDIIKGTIGPDAKPPIPLKKKTIIMYKEMIHGYTFDDTIMQPLYIPGMAEPPPPPIPPKKRTRRRQASQEQGAVRGAAEVGGRKGGSPKKQDTSFGSEFSASTDDLYNEDIDVDDRDVNYLECEESSGYLIFNREESGGYTLRGGPVDALIAYAASTTNAVKHFSEAFLLTYYTFITPEELISRLLYRLDYFYKLGHLAVWTATTSLLVRVLNNLNQPLVKAAEVKLIDMVHQMLTDGNLKFAQLLRNSLVTKLNQLIPDQTKTIPIGRALSSPNRKLSILEFQSDDIARQMTVLDNELFQKVDVAEMLYWAAEQNEDKSPQLTQFTMHFNNVSQWTKTRLLERGMDMKTRVKLMLHFILIMKYLRENYNNFNSYLAILSAVESSPISRLDWPDRVIKGLEEPRALIDNRGSFKNYREAFAQAKPPCIPYIGLYLQDLTFIEMQPSHLEQDKSSINFTKRWKQFKSVDHIRFAQTRQYSFDPDPDILSLFCNFEKYCSDEELWSISNEIKPSARAQRPPQQTAQ